MSTTIVGLPPISHNDYFTPKFNYIWTDLPTSLFASQIHQSPTPIRPSLNELISLFTNAIARLVPRIAYLRVISGMNVAVFYQLFIVRTSVFLD